MRSPGRLADAELVPLEDAAADVWEAAAAAAAALGGSPSVEGVAPREVSEMWVGANADRGGVQMGVGSVLEIDQGVEEHTEK